LKQRELELWKPILTLALFFEKYPRLNGLFQKILDFAKEKAEEKEVENRTETLDLILVKTLTSIVEKDDYYKVSEIKNAVAEYFDEPQKWLTCKWVGNALKRLGFTQKRRMKSYEYFLTLEKVRDLAERLGISESSLSGKCENTVSSVSAPIPDVYNALREQFKEPFDEGKAISFIAQIRKCDFEEAEKLFQIFVDEGRLFRDAYGLWMWISPEQKSEPIHEKKLETISISKTEISRDNSKFEVLKVLIPCEFCAKQGKPMFFATVEDLKGHIRAFHGGYPDSKPSYVT
jgi:transcriptional regulator with XRE-family HTH domain